MHGLESRPALELFGITLPMHRDRCSGVADLTKIIGREFDVDRSDVFLQTVHLLGSRDRNDPWLLREEPAEGDLRRCRSLPLGQLLELLDQGLIRLAILGGEAWHHVAEVAALERRLLVDLAGEKAFSQRAERNEPDAEFLECRYHFGLGTPEPQRVLALECRDGLHGMCAPDRIHTRFG